MGDDAGIGTADRGWRLADRNTARGLDDAGIGTAVGAGVGAAVGDGVWATTPGSARPTGVGGFPTDLRRVDSARATPTGTALPSMPESVRPLAMKAARSTG